MKTHKKFKCPFCMRQLVPKTGIRTCYCGYWIKPVSEDEIKESEEQHKLLKLADSQNCKYICQTYWNELQLYIGLNHK